MQRRRREYLALRSMERLHKKFNFSVLFADCFASAPLSTYHQISCIRFAVHLSLLTPSILCDSADPRCCGIDHSPQPEKA
jgi:hypothetical protein